MLGVAKQESSISKQLVPLLTILSLGMRKLKSLS